MERDAAIKQRVMAEWEANPGRECNVRGEVLAGKRFSLHCDSHALYEEYRGAPKQKYIEFNPAQEWGFSGTLFSRKGISWSFELSKSTMNRSQTIFTQGTGQSRRQTDWMKGEHTGNITIVLISKDALVVEVETDMAIRLTPERWGMYDIGLGGRPPSFKFAGVRDEAQLAAEVMRCSGVYRSGGREGDRGELGLSQSGEAEREHGQ